MAIRAILSDIGNVVAYYDNSLTAKGFGWYADRGESEMEHMLFDRPDGLMWAYARGELSTPEFRRCVAQALGFFPDISDDAFDFAFSKVFSPNADVIALWQWLRKRCNLLITAVSDIEQLRHEELIRIGIMDIFDHTVLSYREGIVKPSKELLVRALDVSGVAAEEAVFIDDLPENLVPATELGIATCRYTDLRSLCGFLNALGVPTP